MRALIGQRELERYYWSKVNGEFSLVKEKWRALIGHRQLESYHLVKDKCRILLGQREIESSY